MGSVERVAVTLAPSALRVDIDPLTATVGSDPLLCGLAPADEAALEWALRIAGQWAVPLTAVTAGPAYADVVLRLALASGATDAVRVALVDHHWPDAVARALAPQLRDHAVVVTGTGTPARGSASVPGLLAGRLGAAQAVGLATVEIGAPGVVCGVRRLDGGRQERLRITAPAVLGVEPGTVRLRRAPLPAVLAAPAVRITVVPPPADAVAPPSRVGPPRPRPKPLAAPAADLPPRDRVRQLAGYLDAGGIRRAVRLAPAEAAEEIIVRLRGWGYL